jgi:ElaB/YqjD/DUF883 family membrane-anchored ribosome-binding protein
MNTQTPQNARAVPVPEDLGHQIETLRADLMTLAARMTNDVSAGLGTAGQQIEQTGRDTRAAATTAVLNHPLAAIGIAAGLGLLLGLISRRS